MPSCKIWEKWAKSKRYLKKWCVKGLSKGENTIEQSRLKNFLPPKIFKFDKPFKTSINSQSFVSWNDINVDFESENKKELKNIIILNKCQYVIKTLLTSK